MARIDLADALRRSRNRNRSAARSAYVPERRTRQPACELSRVVSLTALCVLSAVASAQTPARPSNVTWDADVLDLDFRSDTLELSGNVQVREGDMSIEADAATATQVSSENSRWTFKNDVHIRTAQADLRSSTASASFVQGQIADARVEGSPAEFEQRGETPDRQVQGRAGVIVYDFAAGIVRLEEDVWFSNGKDEFRGDVVIYNVRDERVQINPGGQSGRVRGILRPGAARPEIETKPPRSDENGA